MNLPLPQETIETVPLGRVLLPRSVAVAVIGTFLIVLIGAVYYARTLFLPLILALLLTLTLMPAVRYFSRRGVPPGFSALIFVLVMGGVAFGTSVILANPVAEMIAKAPQIGGQLRDRFSFLQRPIAMVLAAGEQIQRIAEPAAEADTQKVVVAQPGIFGWAAETLTGIGTTLGATLLLSLFLLSSGDLFLQKLVRAISTLRDKKRSLRIVHDVEFEVSRYLVTITGINICLGFLVGTAMALLGMPNPVVWGVAATLLNYIPFIGAIVGITLAAAVALITFPELPPALLPPLAYLGFHLLESWIVTPLTLGRRLELNAVAILVALAFGSWMWGIVGALIAVPLLVVVKAFCDHLPKLATFGDFLSAEAPVLDPPPPAGPPAE
jgi:predicted PurR-regulated permease PerM